MHQEYPCDQFWRNTHRLLDKMTYLRSYLNDMLKKHPQGEGFKLIRKAARRAGNLHPREATELETVSLGILQLVSCLLYTSPSPRDVEESRMPSSA